MVNIHINQNICVVIRFDDTHALNPHSINMLVKNNKHAVKLDQTYTNKQKPGQMTIRLL